jgi:coproporphyrinogen III oxidase-like Fe-S oxidoreductase
MEEIQKYFIIDKNTELTIETVPNRINLKLATYIKKSGFSRVSI